MADLRLRPRPELDHYEVMEDFTVSVLGKVFAVPAGFHYDGASIPAVAWQAIYTPFSPDVMGAALVHDWLYHAHEDQDDADSGMRTEADEIFYQVLLADHVRSGKAKLMWTAVRTFGGEYWTNDERDKELIRALYRRHRDNPNRGSFGFPSWARV